MKQKLQITAVIIAITAVFYFVYHVDVVVPRQEAAAQAAAEEAARQSMMLCLSNVYKTYSEEWDAQCAELDMEADCGLAPVIAELVEARHTASQDHCIRIHQ